MKYVRSFQQGDAIRVPGLLEDVRTLGGTSKTVAKPSDQSGIQFGNEVTA
jgi:hypothetical protein